MKTKRIWIGILIAVLLAVWLIFRVYERHIQKKYGMNPAVASLTIESVPVQTMDDGIYTGSFSQRAVQAEVQVVVQNARIEDVIILKGGVTRQGKRAELIVERMLQQNRNDVDVISGATITSKAILKAAEKALKQRQSDNQPVN